MPSEAKVVLITGSSLGIGAAAAVAFARRGYAVIITYQQNAATAEEVATRCRQAGAAAMLTLPLEITSQESITTVVDQTVDRFGQIDVLVNNAGVVVWKRLLDQSQAEIERQVRINLEGLIAMTKAALPHVTETVINIASGAGLSPTDEAPVYVATKFGVRGFTQAMALDYPEITFLAVNPGSTATRMTGFTGAPPAQVAEVVVTAAAGGYDVRSGGDVNVWEVTR